MSPFSMSLKINIEAFVWLTQSTIIIIIHEEGKNEFIFQLFKHLNNFTNSKLLERL